MPRPRQRTTLESGLKLDLNKLRRQGLIRPGAKCGVVIRWTNTYTGEEIAKGVLPRTWKASTKAGYESNLEASIRQSLLFPSRAILEATSGILSARQ